MGTRGGRSLGRGGRGGGAAAAGCLRVDVGASEAGTGGPPRGGSVCMSSRPGTWHMAHARRRKGGQVCHVAPPWAGGLVLACTGVAVPQSGLCRWTDIAGPRAPLAPAPQRVGPPALGRAVWVVRGMSHLARLSHHPHLLPRAACLRAASLLAPAVHGGSWRAGRHRRRRDCGSCTRCGGGGLSVSVSVCMRSCVRAYTCAHVSVGTCVLVCTCERLSGHREAPVMGGRPSVCRDRVCV